MNIRSAALLAAIALAFAAEYCRAEAGPPLITDDPGTPDKGHFEINTAFTYEDHPREKVAQTPLLDINYGLFDHVQLKLETPWTVEQSVGKHPSGLGDSLAGIKWRFLDEDKYGVAISTYLQVQFRWPAFDVSRDPADDRKKLILPLEFEKGLGPLTVGLEIGYVLEHKATPQNFTGLAVGHQFTDNFELLGEVRETSGPQFSKIEWVANGGFRLKITPLIGLLGAAGTTFRSPNQDRARIISYLALQFTF